MKHGWVEFLHSLPRNAPDSESGRRACSVPPLIAAPTGPPLVGRPDLDRTLEFVAAAPSAEIAESSSRTVILKQGGREVEFAGKDYLFSFALPNFFFHVTTAYDILRQAGLDIGKRDYLG